MMSPSLQYHFATFSDGSTMLLSSLPGVISLGILPADGVHEVSRIDLPTMTQEEFDALLQQTSDHQLRYDEATQRVIAVPKG